MADLQKERKRKFKTLKKKIFNFYRFRILIMTIEQKISSRSQAKIK